MLVVAALGGSAMLRRGEDMTAARPSANIRRAAVALAQIVRAGHRLVVPSGDPAFQNPTKFVGPSWSKDEARAIAGPRGWANAQDGVGWHPIVPSLKPLAIPDIQAVKLLVEKDVIVICGGGSGISIVGAPDDRYHWTEAAIDKDHVSGLLGRNLEADALPLLTDVEGLYRDFGQPKAVLTDTLSVAQAATLDLRSGSIAPKVQACCGFVAGAQ